MNEDLDTTVVQARQIAKLEKECERLKREHKKLWAALEEKEEQLWGLRVSIGIMKKLLATLDVGEPEEDEEMFLSAMHYLFGDGGQNQEAQVSQATYPAPAAVYPAHAALYTVQAGQYPCHKARYVSPAAQHPTPAVQNIAQLACYTAPVGQYPTSVAHCLTQTSVFPTPTPHYSAQIPRYPPLATQYSTSVGHYPVQAAVYPPSRVQNAVPKAQYVPQLARFTTQAVQYPIQATPYAASKEPNAAASAQSLAREGRYPSHEVWNPAQAAPYPACGDKDPAQTTQCVAAEAQEAWYSAPSLANLNRSAQYPSQAMCCTAPAAHTVSRPPPATSYPSQRDRYPAQRSMIQVQSDPSPNAPPPLLTTHSPVAALSEPAIINSSANLSTCHTAGFSRTVGQNLTARASREGLTRNTNLSCGDCASWTVFHSANFYGQTVDTLLSDSTPVDTPLHYATDRNQRDASSLLTNPRAEIKSMCNYSQFSFNEEAMKSNRQNFVKQSGTIAGLNPTNKDKTVVKDVPPAI